MAFGDSRVLDVLYRADGNREGLQLDAGEVADLVAEVEAQSEGRGQMFDEVVAALESVKISKVARAAVDGALGDLTA